MSKTSGFVLLAAGLAAAAYVLPWGGDIDLIVPFTDATKLLPASGASEVAVVASHRRETFRLASVMEFMSDPIGPDRVVTGRYEHRRLPDLVARRMMLAGVRVPVEFAEAAAR